ncbi:hypothetical protein PO587_10625 [Streptomyces gilvifuscus]|uniref:AB hydrolase-1 domain-containing protein n=1 Tax=Streptomyces gilvifuscus TaxID=1550617 RepID=A0ABT5FQX7_9ACTN|nr:hypothetical protein [Streptomyces gilvifuscus]MDC2954919.1 hypothetical protein [Streptomyces gilvifuscus]
MTTVVFVHGTGVREPALTALVAHVGEALRRAAPHTRLIPCDWGTAHGAVLAAGGASIPTDDGRHRGLGTPADAAEEAGAATWELLYTDPFVELRQASAGSGPSGPVPPHEVPADAAIRRRLAELHMQSAELDGALQLTAVGRSGGALRALLDAPELVDAARAVDPVALAELTARAAIAHIIADASEAGDPLIPTASGRDAAVTALAGRLGGRLPGSDRGPTRLLLRAAVPLASRMAVRRRSAITHATHPAAGDIMRYLAAGAGHRVHLADLVLAQSPPVVLLCHSLGGVIAVDTLVERPLPHVELLVTVGSQAPFLYETDALPSLRHPKPLPSWFPTWLNIYDPRDLLAFVAKPLFPDHATDHPLSSGEPFPQSHSAYWSNPELYDTLAARLR